MVVKVYISGVSASKEVKKRQQQAMFILDSLQVDYEAVDVTEYGRESENRALREVCKKRGEEKTPQPPQFFNEDDYCGDWDDFFMASDEDKTLVFLKLADDVPVTEGSAQGEVKDIVPETTAVEDVEPADNSETAVDDESAEVITGNDEEIEEVDALASAESAKVANDEDETELEEVEE